MRSQGSISLNRALLAAGLVDRLEVNMFSAISGRADQTALCRDGPNSPLEITESTVLDGRAHNSRPSRSFTVGFPRASTA